MGEENVREQLLKQLHEGEIVVLEEVDQKRKRAQPLNGQAKMLNRLLPTKAEATLGSVHIGVELETELAYRLSAVVWKEYAQQRHQKRRPEEHQCWHRHHPHQGSTCP